MYYIIFNNKSQAIYLAVVRGLTKIIKYAIILRL